MRVGYQGEPYSYSDRAAGELYPDAEAVGYVDFAGCFAALEAGEVERLVLPVANSTTGAIAPVATRIGSYRREGEVTIPVRHVVAAVAGADVDAVTSVMSHPEALRQAAATLAARGWSAVAAADTAGAAREVAEGGDPTRAALTSPEAARAHGLTVLLRDAVDDLANETRFVAVALPEGGPAP